MDALTPTLAEAKGPDWLNAYVFATLAILTAAIITSIVGKAAKAHPWRFAGRVIRRPFRWLFARRITDKATIAEIKHIRAQRAAGIGPRFGLHPNDRTPRALTLFNWGEPVINEKVTADASLFVFDRPAVFAGPHTQGSGFTVFGGRTDKDPSREVVFRIEWSTVDGDAGTSDVALALTPEPVQSFEDAYRKGREDQSAEHEARRSAPPPEWRAHKDPDAWDTDSWVLVNVTPGSFAESVLLAVDREHFDLVTSPWWQAPEPNEDLHFKVRRLEDSDGIPIWFRITWEDAAGAEHTTDIRGQNTIW